MGGWVGVAGTGSVCFFYAEDQACNRRKILATFQEFQTSPARRCAREAEAQVREEPDTRRAVGG